MTPEEERHQRHLLQLAGFRALGDGHDDAAVVSPRIVVRPGERLGRKSQDDAAAAAHTLA